MTMRRRTKLWIAGFVWTISACAVIGFEHSGQVDGKHRHQRSRSSPPRTSAMESSTTMTTTRLRQSLYFPQESSYSGASSPSSHSYNPSLSQEAEEIITIPIVIMSFILPGQKLHFSSPDPRFDALIRHVLSAHNNHEIGIIGLDPPTQNPLNVGVTAPIVQKDITFGLNRHSERVLATSFKGTRRFQIVGEPWMDPTDSFYISNVRILDHQVEPLTPTQHQQVQLFHHNIPGLIEQWVETVIQMETLSPAGVTSILKDIGPMPSEPTQRAIWVAALLNPTLPLGLCQEIRPAMLSCQNDVDRLALATVALRTSIEQSRKKKR